MKRIEIFPGRNKNNFGDIYFIFLAVSSINFFDVFFEQVVSHIEASGSLIFIVIMVSGLKFL